MDINFKNQEWSNTIKPHEIKVILKKSFDILNDDNSNITPLSAKVLYMDSKEIVITYEGQDNDKNNYSTTVNFLRKENMQFLY